MQLIEILESRLNKAFRIVDHWDTNLHAIGIASTADERQLVYVSTFQHPKGEFFVACEEPSDAPLGYRVARREEMVNLDQLIEIVRTHLHRR